MAIGRTSVPSNKPMVPTALNHPKERSTRSMRRHIGQSLGRQTELRNLGGA